MHPDGMFVEAKLSGFKDTSFELADVRLENPSAQRPPSRVYSCWRPTLGLFPASCNLSGRRGTYF